MFHDFPFILGRRGKRVSDWSFTDVFLYVGVLMSFNIIKNKRCVNKIDAKNKI